MTFATKYRDLSHARIYVDWLDLPAWQELSGTAAKLLAAMLIEYRSGNNGFIDWSAEKAGNAVGRHKATGARLILELIDKGWIDYTQVGHFKGKAKPSRYALAMYPNDVTGEPATNAHQFWQSYTPLESLQSVAKTRLNGRKNESEQSQKCETMVSKVAMKKPSETETCGTIKEHKIETKQPLADTANSRNIAKTPRMRKTR
jgi:hypothetical protein